MMLLGVVLITIVPILVSLCAIIARVRCKRREAFVLEHSITLKRMMQLNSDCVFAALPVFRFEKSFDNSCFFESITPSDYLIYQLVYVQRSVRLALAAAEENKD
jgi:hypothetical protein